MKQKYSLLLMLLVMSVSPLTWADDEAEVNPDPWQGYNRAMFSFNETVDRFFLKPIAKSYKFVMPDPFEKGVSNVFSNIGEVPSLINGVLQANVKGAANHTGRLLVNSTIGIGGLFDVAKHMHLPDSGSEDFGQTLAVWGVGQGPYVVLPLLGPSTLRDAFAKPVDWYTDPITYIEHEHTNYAVRAVSIIDMRAGLLDLEKNITGDRYVFIRDVYLQRREYLINNGEVKDEFGTEDFGAEDFGEEEM